MERDLNLKQFKNKTPEPLVEPDVKPLVEPVPLPVPETDPDDPWAVPNPKVDPTPKGRKKSF